MEREKLIEKIFRILGDEEEMSQVMLADGLEDAFVGVVRQFSNAPLACYSYDKCIEIFMNKEGMTYEEAEEWMSYNVTGAWVGPQTPVFLFTEEGEDDGSIGLDTQPPDEKLVDGVLSAKAPDA